LQETRTQSCWTALHGAAKTNSQLSFQQQQQQQQQHWQVTLMAQWQTPTGQLRRSRQRSQQLKQFAECLPTWLACHQLQQLTRSKSSSSS
jgi:hypothetical protein